MMISKNRQKLLRQLETKKYRDREGLFVAEGPKVISDLLAISPAKFIYATQQWIESHDAPSTEELIEVTAEELRPAQRQRKSRQKPSAAPFAWVWMVSATQAI